jgi:spermidine/putrescine transport system substrate-binding protein
LHIFTWPEYLDPDIVAEFERQFSCKVTLDYFDSPDAMKIKLASGGSERYDIVWVLHDYVQAMIREGLLAPLRHESIPNLKNIDQQSASVRFDPGSRYSAPVLTGHSGLLVRKGKGTSIDETLGLIFDPAKQPGPFLLMDDARWCIEVALRYKGYNPNTSSRTELLEARDLLIEAKKRSAGFADVVGARNRLLSKQIVLAMVDNSSGAIALKEDPETHFFVPREGAGMYLESIAIPARAPHRDLAEQFVNFLLDARISARYAEFARAATPNPAAMEFVKLGDAANPVLYPPPAVVSRMWFSEDLGEKQKLFDEIWTQIKSK